MRLTSLVGAYGCSCAALTLRRGRGGCAISPRPFYGAPRHSARGLLDSSLLLRPRCLQTDSTPGAGGWHGGLAYRRAGDDWRPICCNLEQSSGSGWRAWVRRHPVHVLMFPYACSYCIVDFLLLFWGSFLHSSNWRKKGVQSLSKHFRSVPALAFRVCATWHSCSGKDYIYPMSLAVNA